jgi:thiamine transport system ATP-binding protein
VTVAFGSAVALDGVSLDVAEGEVVAVIGPSGSGKSTLLRAVAGLEPLVGGTISARGRSLVGVPTNHRDLGLMFQDHALFPHLDVAGNVAFGLRMQHWPADRRRDRVRELLDLVGLEGFEGRHVHELSGGEAQRVALARALAPEPSLLMLDEPFGSLDRLLREELTGELRRLLVEIGQTALHVTHDQVEAFALADRVAVVRAGRLQQVGRPVELWRAPVSEFVAEFLGHPNIWTVEVGPGGEVAVGEGPGAVVLEGALPVGDGGGRAPAGCYRVVVPTGAIEVVDGVGSGVVEVGSVAFRDGWFRATGVLSATEGAGCGGAGSVVGSGEELEGPGGASVTFETGREVRTGDRVSVRIALEQGHVVATTD